MRQHLRNAGRMARIGLLLGLFLLVMDLSGRWMFGYASEWRVKLALTVFLALVMGLGGAVYSMILPRFSRGRVPPAGTAQLLAGMAAGAIATGVIALPLLLVPFEPGMPFRGGLLLAAVGIGAFSGAICGLLTPNHRAAHPAPPLPAADPRRPAIR